MSDNQHYSEFKPGSPEMSEAFELLTENVMDYAIFLTDPQGVIVSWNIGAKRILGYETDEALGRMCDMIFTPEDRAAGEPERERDVARATGRSLDERWHMRKDGSRFWGSGIMTGLRDENNRLRGFAKIMRDFTAQRQYQSQIELLNTQLSAVNERLQRVVVETHHRVKNNLQTVGALLELLAQTDTDVVPVSELRRIGQHIEAMAHIHDLLTNETKTDPHNAEIDVAAMLDKLLPSLRRTIGGRPLNVTLDAVRLNSRAGTALAILINEIVSNAVKHGAGPIALSLSIKDEEVRLIVSDDGPGFPPGFDRTVASHTGLELIDSIARLDLGGAVVLENKEEGGARVIVSFPVASAL